MDFIVWLIEMLVKALEDRPASGKTTAPPPRTGSPAPAAPAYRNAAAPTPRVLLSNLSTPPVIDSGDASRLLLTILALLVLIAIVAAWLLFMLGWL